MRRPWLAPLFVIALGGWIGAGAAPALGADPLAPATFLYSGGEQTYVVPSGVTRVGITAAGAPGGSTTTEELLTVPGGPGALVSGYVNVTAGETLFVEVGEAGGNGGHGDVAVFNGGAPTMAPNTGSDAPSGGGGASDVRLCPMGATDCHISGIPDSPSSRLVVAGGGGGAGGCLRRAKRAMNCGIGGAAQQAGGIGTGKVEGNPGHGGGAGTKAHGGAGGAGSPGDPGAASGADGLAGAFGTGGAGGYSDPPGQFGEGGGGGGGGWYGGGGGGQGAATGCGPHGCPDVAPGGGGGGGSSHFANGAVQRTTTLAAAGAGPKVVITPAFAPTVTPSCPSQNLAHAVITCTVTVAGQHITPTGTVTWKVTSGAGAFKSRTCQLDADGHCTVLYRAAGGPPPTQQTLQASYAGDDANLPAVGSTGLTVNEPSADLAIAQTSRHTETGIAFDIVVTNRGPASATNVVVTDALHSGGITTISTASSPSASCITITITGADRARQCTLSALAPDSTWQLAVQVNGGPPGSNVSSDASVGGADPADPIASNDAKTSAGSFGPVANLQTRVAIGAGPNDGQAVTVPTITNLGPNIAHGLSLDIDLTAGTATATVGIGTCSSATPPAGFAFALHCTRPDLPVNQQWRAHVLVSGTNGAPVAVVAQVSETGSYDPNPTNDRAAGAATFAPTSAVGAPGTSWLVFSNGHKAATAVYKIESAKATKT
ncbi:MAG: DUF11 domain-containing protein, partial [Pseudonocardia sp.]|nr:DUF11 domain-containing protein [Pseudonocardia sp.]